MKTILVVDDERDLLSAVSGVLKDEGYDVIEASDGKQALEVLSRQRPDVALVDVMMPFVTGIELVEAVKENPKLDGMPIVLMSAVDDPDVKRSVRAFLKKPFPLKRLLSTVEDVLKAAK
jgi:CheY-like chemotaxis protein